jgi:tetratricopeptide (TPR) repeat protein
MSSKVARLKPRVRPFDEAIDAYRDGRFSGCLGALAQHSSASAVALAARCLIRLGRYDDARQTLEVALVGVAELSHRSRGELEMLRATALGRLGRHIEAECALDDARAYVFSAACPELEAEYLYAEAHMRMITGQFDACVDACSLAIAPGPEVYGAAPHLVPLPHTRARVFQLLGAVAVARGDFTAQRCYLKMAFQEMDECKIADTAFKAGQLASLALLVRESGNAEDAAFVREHATSFPWNADLHLERYLVLHALGWASSLGGDHLGAFRDFRAALETAPSVALKIVASLDKSYLARELRQHLTAAEELEYADRLSESLSAARGPAEESDALVRLAQALAPTQPERARYLFSRAARLRKTVDPRHAYHFDERARVDEVTAEATICRAEGNVSRAIALFTRAFEKWKTFGCGWRAALVAIELAELGAGDEYVAFAREEAERRPTSWFAERARAIPAATLA